jgi:branched-chain amino acid transport system substrate-binding protein
LKQGRLSSLVYSGGISFAAPNYTAQCLAAKQAGATGMEVGDASAIVVKVVMNCSAQGYNPVEFGGDGTVSASWLALPAMQGNVDVQPDIPWFVHDAATKPMYEALDKYAPAVPAGPNFGEIVVQAWAEATEFQLAFEAAHLSGTRRRRTSLKGLYALPKGTTLDGIAPPLGGFVKGKPANNKCFFLMGINHGKFVTLDGGQAGLPELAFSVRTVNTSHPSWAAPPNPRHRDLTASPPEPESRPLDDGRGRSGLGGNRVDGEAR